MDIVSLIERAGEPLLLAAGGAGVGLLFGFFAQRSAFCLRAAVIGRERRRDLLAHRLARPASMWAGAAATDRLLDAQPRLAAHRHGP
jgi:hypothetical protein